jgi:hypothetical protein
MQCLSRITSDDNTQKFGDGRHNFYLEQRCNNMSVKGMDVCGKCIEKIEKYRIQSSRKFDHKKVNEPIPSSSHIFGGEWYTEHAKLWGEPPKEIIKFALQYQQEAREGFSVIQSNIINDINIISKEEKCDNTHEMPRGIPNNPDAPVKKRGRKPQIATIEQQEQQEQQKETLTMEPVKEPGTILEKKKTKKKEDSAPKEPKKRIAKKKKEESPVSIIAPNAITFQEACIPTYIESKFEEFDTEGYEIVHVKLENFELNGNEYYREPIKNKMYKKQKNGIGPYLGRYYPETDEIDADIPDSDEE